MRVFVNAVGATLGGAVRHLSGFLAKAPTLDDDVSYSVHVHADAPLPEFPERVAVTRHARRGPAGRLRWDQVEVARLAKREEADVVLSLLNFGPSACPVPHVVFARNALYYDERHLASLPPRDRYETLARKWLSYAALRSAAAVATPSAMMRDAVLASHSDLDPSKFHVIPHGFDREAFVAPPAPLPADLAAALERRRADVNVLYASHPAPHKGFPVLLHAAHALARRHGRRFHFFLTIERADWPSEVVQYERLIDELGLHDHVTFLGRVPQRAMPALYRACDAHFFPSLAESFGFPLVESMSLGMPVVAASTPIHHEMCGEAAVYYPPLDPVAAADALERVVADDLLRGRLAALGRERSHEFSWDRNVRQTLTLLRGVARARPRSTQRISMTDPPAPSRLPSASSEPRANLQDHVARLGLRVAKRRRDRHRGDNAEFYESYFTERHLDEYQLDVRMRMRRDTVLAALAGLAPGSVVVDFGFGMGDVLSGLPDELRRVGMEFVARNIGFARASGLASRARVMRASAMDAPIASGSADAVLFLEVMEHLPDDRRALAEIARVLKPGGALVIAVPSAAWFPEYFDLMGHYRHYTRAKLVSLLEEAGLAVERYLDDYRMLQTIHYYPHALLTIGHDAANRLGLPARSLYVRRIPGTTRTLYGTLAEGLERLKVPRSQSDLARDERSTFLLARKVKA